MNRIFIVVSLVVLGFTNHPAYGAECQFEAWSHYRGTPLARTDDGSAILYVTGRKAVDADGAPNAYHPADVDKPCGASGKGLDCPANAGYSNTSWWPSVLARDPKNPKRAYVQPTGPYKGFFVSKTALVDSTAEDTDPKRYVDATKIPYLVFPGPFAKLKGTGRLGDLGIAYHTESGTSVPFVVADIGPSEPLGEGSVALFEGLGGKAPNPRNGAGLPKGEVMYVLFPDSSRDREQRWPMTEGAIKEDAERRLAELGGLDALKDCE